MLVLWDNRLPRIQLPKAWLHTYIYTYLHACIHTCIHTYVHTYIHAYIHLNENTYLYVGMYFRLICADRYTHTRIYVYIYIYTYVCTYMSVYIYIIHRMRSSGFHVCGHKLCFRVYLFAIQGLMVAMFSCQLRSHPEFLDMWLRLVDPTSLSHSRMPLTNVQPSTQSCYTQSSELLALQGMPSWQSKRGR